MQCTAYFDTSHVLAVIAKGDEEVLVPWNHRFPLPSSHPMIVSVIAMSFPINVVSVISIAGQLNVHPIESWQRAQVLCDTCGNFPIGRLGSPRVEHAFVPGDIFFPQAADWSISKFAAQGNNTTTRNRITLSHPLYLRLLP